MTDSLAQRLCLIKSRMKAAADRVGRDVSGIRLIGASKKQDVNRIREAREAGLRTFGENRIQEAKAKIPLAPSDIEWHFIGALQTNKARDAVHWFSVIHSVDRMELAIELNKRAAQAGREVEIFLEVNVGGEGSKAGCSVHDVLELVQRFNELERLRLTGLMTVAPFRSDPEQVRPYFAHLRHLRDEVETKTGLALPRLSMGMSHDFEVAIEEGATEIRIGTLLFGARPIETPVNS